ncbi:uncharacterized protein [Rutidosis leptorrhynchoides]|uniref:uncharacterized protein n=1 Tax=Rutidosis leptorrhynchoides TaxID=125765 RepID=UPI003A993980
MVKELDAEEAAAEEAANNVRVPQSRIYIRRDRELACQNLHKHYFQENPIYPENRFRRCFIMSSRLFKRIVIDIINYDVDPLPLHFKYFKQKSDALGRQDFTTIQKCTSAMRQLAYGMTADMFDEYLQMAEGECLEALTACIGSGRIVQLLKGQYTSGHQGHPTIVFEAVASYGTWIWHAFFGAAGANNDLNVLNQSSSFDDIENGTAPFAPFTVNENEYTKGVFNPTDEPRAKFKRFQESALKDVEITFGILQVEDNGYNITWLEEELLRTDEANPNYVRNRSKSRDVREQEIRDINHS